MHIATRLSPLTAALAALFLAGAASAQTAPAAGPASSAMTGRASASAGMGSSKLARADEAFLKQAAQNGHAEVEGSKLALSKGQSAEVKTFAQQMVDDHTKAGSELDALAASKGVKVPTEPSLAQKAKMKVLSTVDGASFDRRYASSVGVDAHQDTVKLFQKAAANAKDAEVKAFAVKTLPTLEHHLKMAQDLKAATAKAGKG